MAEKTTTTNNATKTYNSIIHSSYLIGGKARNYNNIDKRSEEIVDIVTNYPWSIDQVNKNKDGGIINVPHCYAIEYQQRYTSSITNLINSINALSRGKDDILNTIGTVFTNVSSLIQNLSGVGENENKETPPAQNSSGETASDNQKSKSQTPESPSILNTLSIAKNSISNFWGGITNKISGISSSIRNPISSATSNKQNHYMQPYSLLYDLIPTGQRYCMPMISNPPVLQTRNSFSDSTDDASGLSANSFFTKISNWTSGLTKLNRDISSINDIFFDNNSSHTWERTHVEKAKFFQFPTETDTYTIQFPLINTVKLNDKTPAWKQNYKFIMLFCLRNMIFRKDNASYYPPLFYDLIIPGTIRQPYTYVESVNVQPLGVVRMLNGGGILSFLDNDVELSIPVPEAWIVTITFKSLLATSGNLVLSGLKDLPIVASK